jgi:twitching motility protein PilT
MFIGSRAKSTMLDIFTTGLKEIVRATGSPKTVRMKAKSCTISAKSADLTKNIEQLIFIFKMREGATEAEIMQALQSAKVPGRVQVKGGRCRIVTPPCDWKQFPQLAPIDKVIEHFAASTIRSQTWQVEVGEYVNTGININILLEMMEEQGASDLHMRAGNKPFIRIDNDLVPLDMPVVTASDMHDLLLQLGGEAEYELLMTEKESSFQYHAAGTGYLRCSGYVKTGAVALAIRLIPEEPLDFAKLNLPDVVKDVCHRHRGLFLVCGVTGSGKSTTLAAMMDYINARRKVNIITIEDPIEFVYTDKSSIISQRQVGRDTMSFANALRGALREDPDVILVGEMRDVDTIRAGLSAAETGHLVFSTLHTTTSVDTINRMISYFPQNERDLIRQEIAYTLQGVVCQRLLKKIGGGRVPAVEILLGGTPIVRDAILDGDLDKLAGIIEVEGDMRSFDQYAVELYRKGIVSKEEAVSACSNEEGFQRVVSGIVSSEGRRLLK